MERAEQQQASSIAGADEVWLDADDTAAQLVRPRVWIWLRGATCNRKNIRGSGYTGDGNVKVAHLRPEVLLHPPSYAGPKAVRTIKQVLTFFDLHSARADCNAGMVHCQWAGLQFRFLSTVTYT